VCLACDQNISPLSVHAPETVGRVADIITDVAADANMARTVEVEIDDAGGVHPLDPGMRLPPGRAVLYWPEGDELYPALMSEKALEDWLRPEEDAAWAYLQPDK
jgi:hypothetical protein